MKKLTKNECALLAESFLQLAQAVGAYRIENYHRLTPKTQQQIRTYHRRLIDYADTFYESSANFIAIDAQTSLSNLRKIANGMTKTLLQVKKVQRVIHAIGAATKLGASIISQQPIAIAASFQEFLFTVEELKDKTKN